MISKKFIIAVMAVVMAMSVLAGCGGKTEEKKAAQDNSELLEEYMKQEKGGIEDKVPDPNAEELYPCSVFSVKEDGKGLIQDMDELSKEDPGLLLDKMVEFGVLGDGTSLEEFDDADGKAASIKISGKGELDRLTAAAIVNTFTQNFELDSLTVIYNGKTVMEDQPFINQYKEME